MTIKSSGYACTERDKRIIQDTIAPTERGSMIAWLERHCYWPIPQWATDEDVRRIFHDRNDKAGGFVKLVLIKVEVWNVAPPGRPAQA